MEVDRISFAIKPFFDRTGRMPVLQFPDPIMQTGSGIPN